MKKKQFTALLVTAALAVSMLIGCSGSSSSTDSETESSESSESETTEVLDGTEETAQATATEVQAEKVVVAVDDDSFTVSPWGPDGSVRTWTEMQLWTRLCYRPFIGAMLEDDELELVAAKSITKVDDTTYEVEIYEGITDILGNELTASDIVFSYDTLLELGYVSYIGTYYESSEVVDDYTVQIHLVSATDGAIEEVLCDTNLCSQSWYENATEDEIQSSPACTGAYYVSDVQTGSSVTLMARDDYWKTDELTTTELQNVKEIDIRCISEDSMRTIALENDEVDMAEVNVSEVSNYEDDADYNVTKFQNAMSQYLIFNTSENSVCQDENVRKAIAYAFDTWTMTLGDGHDQHTLLYDVAPNLAPDYVDEWDSEEYYEESAEKTLEYLAAAGYEPGELTVRLMVSTQAPQGPYEAMQAMMLENGINLEILSYDRALRNEYIYDSTQWDLCENSASMRDFTTSYWSVLFSDEGREDTGTLGFTIDETLQELLDAAIEDKSEENMNAFHDYVKEHCYMIGLYNETKSIVTQSGITDICLQKLDPLLNAMTFTSDYVSVVQ